MPPVVGMSAAVMPTRITCSADALPTGTVLRKAATASQPSCPSFDRLFVIPADAGTQVSRAATVALDPRCCGGNESHIGISDVIVMQPWLLVRLRQDRCQQSFVCSGKSPEAFLYP